MNLCLTDHALQRARQRLGWKPATLCRMIPRVLRCGLWGNRTPAALQPWLGGATTGPASDVAVAFGHHRFVFALDTARDAMVLKTVVPLAPEQRRIVDRRRGVTARRGTRWTERE